MSQDSVGRNWGQWDLLKLNSFSFGITGFILAMDTIVLPIIVLTVAPEGLKNTYLATLGIGGLLMAALIQPTIGQISDRTQTPFGRRVPFILWGAIFAAIGLIGIRLAPNFGILFGVWIFIQFNVNIAYGPGLALIRDLVPLHRIGMASSMKILSDAAGAAVMIAVTGALIGKTEPDIDWTWISLGILAFLLILPISITSVQVSRYEFSLPSNSQYQKAKSSFRSVLTTQLAIAVYISGWVSDRVGRKPMVMVGAIGAAVSTLWMLTANDSVQVLIIGSVIGASVGVVLSANWALANELADESQAGLHIGIVNLATIGGAVTAKFLGPIIDALNQIPGRSDGFGYQVLITADAAFFLIGAMLLMPLQQTSHEKNNRNSD